MYPDASLHYFLIVHVFIKFMGQPSHYQANPAGLRHDKDSNAKH